MFYTYVLKSQKTGKYYIGSTEDIERRVFEHNYGSTNSTRHQGPWELVHFEKYQERHDALVREKQIKSYKGGNVFKKLLKLI